MHNHIGFLLTFLAIGALSRHVQILYGARMRDNLLSRWNVKARVVRTMHMPFVWRCAVNLAMTQPCNDTGICLHCHAVGRLKADQHQPKDSPSYIIVCGKCGLPKNKWGKRCTGTPKFVRQPVRKPVVISKPAFWS